MLVGVAIIVPCACICFAVLICFVWRVKQTEKNSLRHSSELEIRQTEKGIEAELQSAPGCRMQSVEEGREDTPQHRIEVEVAAAGPLEAALSTDSMYDHYEGPGVTRQQSANGGVHGDAMETAGRPVHADDAQDV